MPLNSTQKTFIKETIIDFLDEFIEQKCDKETLTQQLRLLKMAVTPPPPDMTPAPPETIKDFFFYNVLRQPADFFQKLEEWVEPTDAFTNAEAEQENHAHLPLPRTPLLIEEVQAFILHFISERICAKANALGIKVKEEWDLASMQTMLSSQEGRIYKPIPVPPAIDGGTNPYADENPNRTFNFTTRFTKEEDATHSWVTAFVTTQLTAHDKIETTLKVTAVVDEQNIPLDFRDVLLDIAALDAEENASATQKATQRAEDNAYEAQIVAVEASDNVYEKQIAAYNASNEDEVWDSEAEMVTVSDSDEPIEAANDLEEALANARTANENAYRANADVEAARENANATLANAKAVRKTADDKADANEDVFLKSQWPKAQAFAENTAAMNTLHYLIRNGLAAMEDYQLLPDDDDDFLNSGIKIGNMILPFETIKILTNRYLLSLIINKTVSLPFLENLKSEAIDSLLDESVIILLKAGIFDLIAGTLIQPWHRRVFSCPFYLSEMLAGKMLLEDILPLSPEQCAVIIRPSIVNLRESANFSFTKPSTITFQESIVLEPYHAHLIEHPLYSRLISNVRPVMDWASFQQLTETDCLLLTRHDITSLVLDLDLPIENIMENLPSALRAIYGAPLAAMIMNNDITVIQADQLDPSVIDSINSHTQLKSWLDCGILSIDDLLRESLDIVHITAFSNRLYAIYKMAPHTILSTKDSLTCITSDLERLSQTDRDSFPLFPFITRNFISLLKYDITNRVAAQHHPQLKTHYNHCLDVIRHTAEKQAQQASIQVVLWQQTLATLISDTDAIDVPRIIIRGINNRWGHSTAAPGSPGKRRREFKDNFQEFKLGLKQLEPLFGAKNQLVKGIESEPTKIGRAPSARKQ